MMTKVQFIAEKNNERITLEFNETCIENTINRFFGFLLAKGEVDLVIKNAVKSITDGNWHNSLNETIGASKPIIGAGKPITALSISPTTLSIDSIKPINLEQYYNMNNVSS